MDRPIFVIEASEAESMAKNSGLSLLQLLPSLVKQAQTLARPPISKYHVGAAGLASDGRIFLGVNLEFPGLPLSHSVHAEQFLLTNLSVHRRRHSPLLLRHFAVSAAPCGHCRQFLQEVRNASDVQFLITSSENESDEPPIFNTLSSILPNPFGPHDLLDRETPLILEPHNNGLSLSPEFKNLNSSNLSNGFSELCSKNQSGPKFANDSNSDNLCNGLSDLYWKNDSELKAANNSNSDNLCNGFSEFYSKSDSQLKLAALEAANDSHSPYSHCPSGVALMDCEGSIYRGSYTESAAFNPSLGPVQAALVAYVAGGGGAYDRIVAGVLVEKEGAVVRQEDTAKLLLKTISPKCEFWVFQCFSGSDVFI